MEIEGSVVGATKFSHIKGGGCFGCNGRIYIRMELQVSANAVALDDGRPDCFAHDALVTPYPKAVVNLNSP